MLVAFGLLNQRQLERYLAQHTDEEDQATSGEALLERGTISADELQHALAYQAQQLVYRMVDTRNAVFRLREGMQIELAFQVSLDIDTLLLESARVLDESAHQAGPGAASRETGAPALRGYRLYVTLR